MFLPIYCLQELISCSLVSHTPESFCTLLVEQTPSACFAVISMGFPYIPLLARNLLPFPEVPNGKLRVVPTPGILSESLNSFHMERDTSQAELRSITHGQMIPHQKWLRSCGIVLLLISRPGIAYAVASSMIFGDPEYMEVIPLSGVLAKHLEIAFKGQKRQNWQQNIEGNQDYQCLLLSRAEKL